jgi:nucleoside-diphosphate-sugar epimerase
VVDFIRGKFPERDFVPIGHKGVYRRGSKCDAKKIREELGLEFRSLKESIEDLGIVLFEMFDKEKK